MFLERIFAAISVAAFALGAVVQLGWLTGNAPAWLTDELTILFFAIAILPFTYVVAYAGKRDGLPYDIKGIRPVKIKKTLSNRSPPRM